MIEEVSKKKQAFQTEIRRQNFKKIFNLKRMRPKLIESDQDALTIMIDGKAILKNKQSEDEQIMAALKSISGCLKKYEFHDHTNLLNSIIDSSKQIVQFDKNRREIIKQAACQVIMLICINDSYKAHLSNIPFIVFEGFNLEQIRYTLIALSSTLSEIDRQTLCQTRQFLGEINLSQRLLQIIANFIDKKICFEKIKIPFLNCSTTLCYMAYKWGINVAQQDYQQLINFTVRYIQDDIIQQSKRDQTLGVFFYKKYQARNYQTAFEMSNQFSYPFGVLSVIVSFIREVPKHVFDALVQCLHIQIINLSIQFQLVKCLAKILKETHHQLQENIKEQIFSYIFSLEYQKAEDQDCLKHIIVLALNHSVNCQLMDESIFKYIGDPMNNKFPKTCHLLQVMEYLEQKQDKCSQVHLLNLIENYIHYNHSLHYIDDCLNELAIFQQAQHFLKNIGYRLIDNEQYMDLERQNQIEI